MKLESKPTTRHEFIKSISGALAGLSMIVALNVADVFNAQAEVEPSPRRFTLATMRRVDVHATSSASQWASIRTSARR